MNESLFQNTVGNSNFISSIGLDYLPHVSGKLLSASIENDEHNRLIQSIPTETSYRERKLYYNFFKYFWTGKYDVLEIGPFLGGSTRSIALGMMENVLRNSARKLHTIDKFKNYNIKSLERILELNYITESKRKKIREQLNNNSDFELFFDELHNDYDYYNIVNKIKGGLPNVPREDNDIKLNEILQSIKLECVFVDGCKSWYSTKYLLKSISYNMIDNGYLIFQDYGWYTCFWIPLIVWHLRNKLTLIASVDTTYIFQVTESFKNEDFEKIPSDPKELNKSVIESAFKNLLYISTKRSDYYYLVIGRIHLAAALAYCGFNYDAKILLQNLLSESFATDFKDIINNALVSPTYSPTEGKIML